MKRGLPLSLRIFLQALLNLVLLGGLGWALFRGQFGLGLDALLAGRAGDRLQGMADVLAGELAKTPAADWNTVLARHSEAYQLKLMVVRPDGHFLAGEKLELPPEIRQRLLGGGDGGRGAFFRERLRERERERLFNKPFTGPGPGPEGEPGPGNETGGRRAHERETGRSRGGERGEWRPPPPGPGPDPGARTGGPPPRRPPEARSVPVPAAEAAEPDPNPGFPVSSPSATAAAPPGAGKTFPAPATMPGPPPPPPNAAAPPRAENPGAAGSPSRPRFLIRAGDPPQYWAGFLMSGLNNAAGSRSWPGAGGGTGRFGMALLLAAAPSLTAGGWVIDPIPWVLGGFGAVLLSILLWFPLVRGVTRSLRQITTATERMAEGRFDTAVPVTRGDELGRLGTAVNHLSGRLDHFVHGQRRFLGDIAHELCSPLARMQLGATLMEREADPAQRERARDVREEVELMTSLVNELLAFSKAGLQSRGTVLQPVNLAETARQAAAREAGSGDDNIRITVPDSLTALAEPEFLIRAVANLVRNALRYAGTAGPVTIGAAGGNDHVVLTVSDCGPGVPEGDLERIFEPFYRPDTARTREAGGTGLGLAIVRTCADACQAVVSARNRQPSGLEVTLRLQPAP